MFMKIETYSNWCSIDKLDGLAINPVGEKVTVQWPDGTRSIETLQLELGTSLYHGMGHDHDMPNHRAFICVNYHGLKSRIYLRETDVKLERQ